MASVNMAVVVGFLGSDPRITTMQTGKKNASFSVATTEKGYTAQNGTTYPDKTEWHNIVCWGKLAEVAERYLRKGSSVYVQGKMRTRSYEKDGQMRYSFEIECETLQLLDRQAEQNPNNAAAQVRQNYERTANQPHQSAPDQDDRVDTPF